MTFDIVYQYYIRQSRSVREDIDSAKSTIDPSFRHSFSERTLYVTMNLQDLAVARDLGYLVMEKNSQWSYAIQELKVTFTDVPEEDYNATCDHLLELYGEKAVYAELRKTTRLGEPL